MDGWKEWLSKKALNCTFVKAKDGFLLKIKAWKCVCKCGSTDNRWNTWKERIVNNG